MNEREFHREVKPVVMEVRNREIGNTCRQHPIIRYRE